MSKLQIWTTPVDTAIAKGGMVNRTEAILTELDPESLNASLKALATHIDIMLSDVAPKGGYSLSSIEIAVEITAEAGINLIGTAKAGGKAGLVLSFQKRGAE